MNDFFRMYQKLMSNKGMCSFSSTQILHACMVLAYETEYTAEEKTVQVPLCLLVRQFAFGQVCLLVKGW